MVNENKEDPKCGACQEIRGCVWQGFIYCNYLQCDVYAESLMCQHGLDLLEMF